MKYWINVVSKDHIARGIAGGFMQANHGKVSGLKRLKAGDWIAVYSPKTAYQGGDPLQAFTAIGQVADDELYQSEVAPDFIPWRRNLTYYDCTEMSIKPLIDDLSFIQDKTHWGYRFRFGLFEIPEADFSRIKDDVLNV
jgi:hypothetical protein